MTFLKALFLALLLLLIRFYLHSFLHSFLSVFICSELTFLRKLRNLLSEVAQIEETKIK